MAWILYWPQQHINIQNTVFLFYWIHFVLCGFDNYEMYLKPTNNVKICLLLKKACENVLQI